MLPSELKYILSSIVKQGTILRSPRTLYYDLLVRKQGNPLSFKLTKAKFLYVTLWNSYSLHFRADPHGEIVLIYSKVRGAYTPLPDFHTGRVRCRS